MGSGAIYLPILGILAGALLFFGILPPGNLIGKVRQLVPELIGQRPFVHVDRNSIGLAAAVLHGGGVGHGIGEVHRYAVTGRQRLDAVGGDHRGQLRHISAAGHGDGNGIGAVVHRTGHAVDGEAGDALGSRGGRLPLAGDVDVTGRHLEAVIRDNLVHRSPTLSKAIAQGALHHLITAVGRYGDDNLIALVGLGAVGGDGTALGGAYRDLIRAGIRRIGATAIGGDLHLQGSTLTSGGVYDHNVNVTGVLGQIAEGDGVLALNGRCAVFAGIHRGCRCIVIHHLIVVGTCHIGGERHRCGGLAAAGGGAIGQ